VSVANPPLGAAKTPYRDALVEQQVSWTETTRGTR